MLTYKRLAGYDDLSVYLDDIIAFINMLFEKAKPSSSSPEVMFGIVKNLILTKTGFVLMPIEDGKPRAMLVALVVPSKNAWMEIVMLSAQPGYFFKCWKTGFKLLKEWGLEFGAKRIVTAATNRPEVLKRMYKRMGFKQIGYVLEEG